VEKYENKLIMTNST